MVPKATLLFASLTILAAISTLYSSVNYEPQLTAVQDTKSNITDAEYNRIIKTIADAENKFNSTNFELIADYISLNIQDTVNQLKWNVYAYEGAVKQIAVNTSSSYWNKYMWLVNYGKYKNTYIFLAFPTYYCSYKYETTGGSSLDQFGPSVTESEQQSIMGVIDNSIIYQGNNITANAIYIQEKMRIVIKANWAIIITDPNARYGYHICRAASQKWFALRQFKTFKWNYFGSST